MSLCDKSLGRWYREYNRRWFAGALPPDVDVLYAPIEGCSGDVQPSVLSDYIIRINPLYSLDSRVARMTLLHEMVHIPLWPNKGHGPKFNAEMQRLAAAGAFRGLW